MDMKVKGVDESHSKTLDVWTLLLWWRCRHGIPGTKEQILVQRKKRGKEVADGGGGGGM